MGEKLQPRQDVIVLGTTLKNPEDQSYYQAVLIDSDNLLVRGKLTTMESVRVWNSEIDKIFFSSDDVRGVLICPINDKNKISEDEENPVFHLGGHADNWINSHFDPETNPSYRLGARVIKLK